MAVIEKLKGKENAFLLLKSFVEVAEKKLGKGSCELGYRLVFKSIIFYVIESGLRIV